jgi:hypothetical protein
VDTRAKPDSDQTGTMAASLTSIVSMLVQICRVLAGSSVPWPRHVRRARRCAGCSSDQDSRSHMSTPRPGIRRRQHLCNRASRSGVYLANGVSAVSISSLRRPGCLPSARSGAQRAHHLIQFAGLGAGSARAGLRRSSGRHRWWRCTLTAMVARRGAIFIAPATTRSPR